MAQKCMELRMQGLTYNEIGKAVGISHMMAYNHVMHALEYTKEQTKEQAPKVRQMELQRLDKLLKTYWPRANNKKKPDLKATEMLLKISERRARLMGLDAPTKVKHEGDPDNPVVFKQLTDQELDNQIQSLITLVGYTPVQPGEKPVLELPPIADDTNNS